MKKNKPGLNIQMDKEKILMFSLVALVAVFVMCMPLIYRFFVNLKNGTLFPKEPDNGEVDKPIKPEDKPNEETPTPEPSNKQKLTCTLVTSTANGDLTENVIFYYTGAGVENLKTERNYNASTDEYLNYIYAEQARFNSMKTLYSKVNGYSFSGKLSDRTYVATTNFDLSKVTSENFKNEDEGLTIVLDVTYRQSLEEVKALYTTKGYSCK